MVESAKIQSPPHAEMSWRNDRVQLGTRLVAGFVIIILVLAVSVLYILPDSTDRLFAWTITPNMTALAMGAGYAMGAYFFARVLLSNRWHRSAPGFLPITSFTIMMLHATLLHWDRFHQGTVAFALWFVVYAITPFLVPLIWLRNHSVDPSLPEPDDVEVAVWIRRASGLAGLAIVLAAIAVFLIPDLAIRIWPWQLTPLTARVLSGWMMLFGAGGIALSREAWWSSGWRLMVESAIVAAILFLIGTARALTDWRIDNPLNLGILFVVVAATLFLIGSYTWAVRRSKMQGA